MDPQTYRLLHIVGLFAVFLGLGGSLALVDAGKSAGRAIALALHGLGLIVVLVAGFGLQAKLLDGFPMWLITKIALWLVIGALPFLVRKRYVPPVVGWIVALAAGATAAWLVLERPF